MEKSSFFCFVLLLLLPFIQLQASSSHNHKAYIVYFGEHHGDKSWEEIEARHHSYLMSVKESEEDAKSSLLYNYKHSINAFAAILTPQQASKLSELDEVVSVIESKKYRMHTTRSWEFSGVEEDKPTINDLVYRANYGKDVVIGMLDSGVWPKSKSFSDKGMGPIPKSWKGICQTGPAFQSAHCNRKIIGARYYLKGYEHHFGRLNETADYRSPCDKDGHGSHTASIAGGRRVYNVSAFGGVAWGTASGGAPWARLAIYKVCWAIPNQMKALGNVCFDTDMLAAMDDAIADGVDVLSLSIGKSDPYNYTDDGIAIGALHAVKRDIVVSCSAGNYGPTPSALSNIAPWIITVGASTVDREFYSPVILGNGLKIKGLSVAPSKLKRKKMYPLVYAGDILKPHVPRNQSGLCVAGSLSHEKAKGKIVLCFRGEGISRFAGSLEVKRSGGAGMILGNVPAVGRRPHADPHFVPATAVSYEDANMILKYIKSRTNPTANIVPPITIYGSRPAPAMANFSSRGPNPVDPHFLKPDITAPGVDILAAWSEQDSPTKLPKYLDPRIVKYNLYSGTSMSCPHVSAAAALLRAIHPSWSQAAIRSALMTTATTINKSGHPLTDDASPDNSPASPFSFGSGHFRPSKAADPGLVYDSNYTDYLHYLCGLKMNSIDPSFTCPPRALHPHDLNYPSIAVPRLRGAVRIKRTVTNVGGGGKSVYFFHSEAPPGVAVSASPNILYFNRVGERKRFTITVSGKVKNSNNNDNNNGYSFGWFAWTDGIHYVRSPIAVSST
ncbi:subtilisin-like protease SBT5.6 [Benincasa hispida]|uniref:subtilisin-like protease SBT5.6 n=1 Tax=Benincasa hispida TaxID=102211 RepID=UPI001902A081|nr:subtilisin-like protease SBT5.6 [Benincasa hispida]